jgi:hypothetical protein
MTLVETESMPYVWSLVGVGDGESVAGSGEDATCSEDVADPDSPAEPGQNATVPATTSAATPAAEAACVLRRPQNDVVGSE